jgi:Carboxylesterase family
VHDNIGAFGGDPSNVMIFGESGGGTKTSCLYTMPAAAPHEKASIESGLGIRMLPRDAAAETTLMTLKYLGLEKAEWRKLLEVPVDKLLAAQNGVPQQASGGGPLTQNGGRLLVPCAVCLGRTGTRRSGLDSTGQVLAIYRVSPTLPRPLRRSCAAWPTAVPQSVDCLLRCSRSRTADSGKPGLDR